MGKGVEMRNPARWMGEMSDWQYRKLCRWALIVGFAIGFLI